MPEPTSSPAMRSPRRAALLVNPASGSAPDAPGAIAALTAALDAAGYALVQPPRPDLALDAQIAVALAVRPEVIFTLGGDGSLRAVAEHILAHDIVLGVLPGGTMNRVAARLDMPADPIEAARSLMDAEVERLAVGALNGRVFLYQCLVGRSSRLVRFREMQRGVGVTGWLPLVLAALRLAARPPRRALRLLGEGETVRADAVVVTTPLPGDDPLFRIEAVRRGSRLAALRQAWRWIRGRLAEDRDVVTLSRPHLAMTGRDAGVRVTLDGEQRLMAPPLRFRLRPAALRVLRPRRG